MPEISVIIPMYKTPKLLLRKCLDSLIGQTFTDFEVLVIDDGNEPGYEYIQEEYEKKDSRITFIRQENGGVSSARNRGIQQAKGKYISFVDSDDYADPSFLAEMHEAMQDADVAICAVSETYFPVYPGWTDRRVFWSKPSYYNGLQYINFCHNKMFRRDLIVENNLLFPVGMKLGEDAIFVCNYLKLCKSFRKVREPRYHYVPEASSAMRKYQEEFWYWEHQVMDMQWKCFHQYPLSEFEEQAMEHWLFMKMRFALSYYMDREKDNAKRKEKIRDICSSPYFERVCQCKLKGHRHFWKKDRQTIQLWRHLGANGVFLIYFAGKIRRKLLHR